MADRPDQNQKVTFLRGIKVVIDDCVRLANTDHMSGETVQYCITRLEVLYRKLQRAAGNLIEVDTAETLKTDVQELLDHFRRNNENQQVITGYAAGKNNSPVGAPHYNISRQQLQFLHKANFNIPQISDMLQVSVRTVKRRMATMQLSVLREFSGISNNDLDTAVRNVVRTNQKIGPNAVRARLMSQGIKVQRKRVRDSMHRVDPGAVALRLIQCTRRRTYAVAGPNSLWHVDGNHKLIRWRFVIHGGIDGYSRMFTFLRASARNTKEVVAGHFLHAVSLYGLPSRLRVDHGGENVDICHIMEFLRGPGRGSAIQGKSVHNQRIERSWVDMWNGVTNVYYDLFHFLEQRGSLDIENTVHLWALHYIFEPRINRDLDIFRNQWNNHGLRTAHHLTPIQLFIKKSLQLCNTNLTAMQDLFLAPETEAEHQAANEILDGNWHGGHLVDVPAINCPLTDQDLAVLKTTVNPLGDDAGELGAEKYLEVVDYVNSHQ